MTILAVSCQLSRQHGTKHNHSCCGDNNGSPSHPTFGLLIRFVVMPSPRTAGGGGGGGGGRTLLSGTSLRTSLAGGASARGQRDLDGSLVAGGTGGWDFLFRPGLDGRFSWRVPRCRSVRCSMSCSACSGGAAASSSSAAAGSPCSATDHILQLCSSAGGHDPHQRRGRCAGIQRG